MQRVYGREFKSLYNLAGAPATPITSLEDIKEDVSKINEGPENRLNDYQSPSGIRIKRGCIVLLIHPLLTLLFAVFLTRMFFSVMDGSNVYFFFELTYLTSYHV
jgi:hypothetical protein